MPNPIRVFTPGVPYHVISRGSRRLDVFRDSSDYEVYLRILMESKRKFEVLIHHYVLMPNHVHLIACPTSDNGSDFMRHLNLAYAKYACNKYRIVGHLWQHPFKNPPIDSDAYLLASGNYIEMNPVRWGLVTEAGGWSYSSFRHYAEGKANDIIDETPLIGIFGKTAEDRCANYLKWIGTTRSCFSPAKKVSSTGVSSTEVSSTRVSSTKVVGEVG